MITGMHRTNVFTALDGVTTVTVLRGRHRSFSVRFWPNGRCEVRDTSTTTLGRVVGQRSDCGMPFRGSSDARDAVRVAMQATS